VLNSCRAAGTRPYFSILAHFRKAIFDLLNKNRTISFFVPFLAHFSARDWPAGRQLRADSAL
jgi:hypothetical protein